MKSVAGGAALAVLVGLAGSAAAVVLAAGCDDNKSTTAKNPPSGPGSDAAAAGSGRPAETAAPGKAPREFVEPVELQSENGVLDLLMVARAATPKTAPPSPDFLAKAWIYEICRRPAGDKDQCPPNPAANFYGGTRLALMPGDLLKVRLVNQLPPVPEAKHAAQMPYLAQNPTNLHTHGMLVSPHEPTRADPTYGDNVFVLTFNPANGDGGAGGEHGHHAHGGEHADHGRHGVWRSGFTDYSIQIPRDHPSGLFWFHPHAHGVALNQLSAGLSGIITVGRMGDTVDRPDASARHLILKDSQIAGDGTLHDQEESTFCGNPPDVGWAVEDAGHGRCVAPADAGVWHFSVTGQEFPQVTIEKPGSQIWRVTNASGSATYDSRLWNRVTRAPMLVQVLSIDGITVTVPATVGRDQLAAHVTALAGAKLRKPTLCPGVGRALANHPVCVESLLMMPSSRAEILVVYRDDKGVPAVAPPGAGGTLQTVGFTTGPIGDTWPPIDLATFSFAPDDSPAAQAEVALGAVETRAAATDPFSPTAPTLLAPVDVDPAKKPEKKPVCRALPPGHGRRVFFSQPSTNNADLGRFGLAFEEIDESGKVVGAEPDDVQDFPQGPHICLPLGPGNTPVTERWEIVNLTGEDHNFHIHQVKFHLVSRDRVVDGGAVPRGVWLDNVPLPFATSTPDGGADGGINGICPIASWRKCGTKPVTVEIPFKIAGEFVYHCHILEHEDGGMMAKIRVVPSK